MPTVFSKRGSPPVDAALGLRDFHIKQHLRPANSKDPRDKAPRRQRLRGVGLRLGAPSHSRRGLPDKNSALSRSIDEGLTSLLGCERSLQGRLTGQARSLMGRCPLVWRPAIQAVDSFLIDPIQCNRPGLPLSTTTKRSKTVLIADQCGTRLSIQPVPPRARPLWISGITHRRFDLRAVRLPLARSGFLLGILSEIRTATRANR